jgi:hypothetical protein
MNTIGSEILQALNHAIDLAEDGNTRELLLQMKALIFLLEPMLVFYLC